MKSNQDNSQKYIHILLIFTISGLLIFSYLIKADITQTRILIGGTSNKQCKNYQEQYGNCIQKLSQCKGTKIQFQQAYLNMQQLVKDCQQTNEQNRKINQQLKNQIIKIQRILDSQNQL